MHVKLSIPAAEEKPEDIEKRHACLTSLSTLHLENGWTAQRALSLYLALCNRYRFRDNWPPIDLYAQAHNTHNKHSSNSFE